KTTMRGRISPRANASAYSPTIEFLIAALVWVPASERILATLSVAILGFWLLGVGGSIIVIRVWVQEV
ncbi:MAG: hypothetical protein AB7O66_19175, partial [Limisphaerales bacterium]